MNNITQKTVYLLAMFMALFSASSFASVVISGTRVIYPQNEKEVTVKITNAGKSPVLVQSWIDDGDVNSRPDNIKVPFILTPPINRIDSSNSQTLRISYTGTNLPEDRESVFWLNVLEIPQTAKIENRLQVAFRSRIKLFYRPAGLQGLASDAAKNLTWSRQGNTLVANNKSPYFVSLVSIEMNKSSIEGEMVPPFGTHSFPLKNTQSGKALSYQYVNDWGAVNTQNKQL
ncbi:fimbria/pilus periplasmic chaperone [Rosenbergiella epipactidis]|uniref:fimbria/pilus periplasmic chaperone n=1 Tax=Rosenbergiella epipactidis TaxID=1544694 RepID=UPI001F4D89D3|nr:fimbria/pilus periplasmic chaperone [Rosenbergiella epipactidis]